MTNSEAGPACARTRARSTPVPACLCRSCVSPGASTRSRSSSRCRTFRRSSRRSSARLAACHRAGLGLAARDQLIATRRHASGGHRCWRSVRARVPADLCGLLYTTASRASLFLYTAPFFVALGARWFCPASGLARAMGWAGAVLCRACARDRRAAAEPSIRGRLIGDFLLIGAGASWAATTLVIKASTLRHSLAGKDAGLSARRLGADPGGRRVLLRRARRPACRRGRVVSLAYQVLVWASHFHSGSALIQRYSATRVSAFTFLTPLFGVAAGYLLLDEPFTLAFGASVVLVLVGLAWLTGRDERIRRGL